ncbi:MAG: AI-2E family transporter [Terracidiphilus sp.]
MTQSTAASRSVRGHIVFVFVLALVLYVAWQVRGVLVLLYVSALFAVVLTPVVRATSRVRVGRWQPFHGSLAILILLLAVAGVLTTFGFLALPPVIHDLQSLNGELPTRVPALLAKLREIPFVDRLNSGQIIGWAQDASSHVATYLLLSLRDWAGAFVQVVAGFVLTLYFILEGEGAYHWFLSFLTPRHRQRLDKTLQRAAIRMGKWLLGQASLMLILGIASTIVYLSLGVRYAYALGVISGLLNVIPVLGAAISITLALLVAAIDSWGRVLGVAVFYLVYLQIENSLLVPRIMKNRVNLPALGIFAALLLGSALEGILGAMVAIPTAVLVTVLIDEYLVRKDEV